MKTPKEQAEELVEKYLKLNIPHYKLHIRQYREKHYIEVAIFSVKHTIEVLEKVAEKGKVDLCGEFAYQENVLIAINQQTEILTELKSKL